MSSAKRENPRDFDPDALDATEFEAGEDVFVGDDNPIVRLQREFVEVDRQHKEAREREQALRSRRWALEEQLSAAWKKAGVCSTSMELDGRQVSLYTRRDLQAHVSEGFAEALKDKLLQTEQGRSVLAHQPARLKSWIRAEITDDFDLEKIPDELVGLVNVEVKQRINIRGNGVKQEK